jgi:hypothetical protein
VDDEQTAAAHLCFEDAEGEGGMSFGLGDIPDNDDTHAELLDFV